MIQCNCLIKIDNGYSKFNYKYSYLYNQYIIVLKKECELISLFLIIMNMKGLMNVLKEGFCYIKHIII